MRKCANAHGFVGPAANVSASGCIKDVFWWALRARPVWLRACRIQIETAISFDLCSNVNRTRAPSKPQAYSALRLDSTPQKAARHQTYFQNNGASGSKNSGRNHSKE
jgi:hypothetical protein